MKLTDYLLLTYSAFDGKISGKTLLQKNLYFIGVLTGDLDMLSYKPHFYGPYSSAVAEANETLKALGYLQETSHSGGNVNAQGFEVTRYDYALTKDGKTLLAEKGRRLPTANEKINKAVRKIKKAGVKNLNYMELSVAAKIYFVLDEHAKSATTEEIIKKAEQFDWNLKPKQLDRACQFLFDLGLVKKVAPRR